MANKPLTTETGAILTAVAALSTHLDSHQPPCGACMMGVATLFEAISRWVGFEDVNSNRAKLEEVFGGKKIKQEEAEKQAESGDSEKGKEYQGAEPEDDWQKAF